MSEDPLKLIALDADDLAIISAHMQDAVFKVGDLSFSARSGLFSLAANRFVWEKAARTTKSFERRRAALSFKLLKVMMMTTMMSLETLKVSFLRWRRK